VTDFAVYVTEHAVLDLEGIYDVIAGHDSLESAEAVLGKIEAVFSSLAAFPERGVYPGELLALGIREYREVFSKPYRIIYRVMSGAVYVYLIADGRRDMRTLLQRRLLAD
jgi:toxin ParE1/3/4